MALAVYIYVIQLMYCIISGSPHFWTEAKSAEETA